MIPRTLRQVSIWPCLNAPLVILRLQSQRSGTYSSSLPTMERRARRWLQLKLNGSAAAVRSRGRSLQSAELLYRFFNGFSVFDERVHAVFFEVQLLRQYQDLRSDLPGYDHDSIAIRGDDVAGIDLDSVTHDWNSRARNPIVSGGSGRDDAARIDGESNFAQIGYVTHASVDDRACEFARRHGRAHQPTHPCNVSPILHGHHIHRVFGSLVDRGEHRGVCIGIVIFFLHHLYGY